MIENCVYCDGRVYPLAEGMLKCTACRRKFSPRKYEKELRIIEHFCRGSSAKSAAEALGVSYAAVSERYGGFRLVIAAHLEACYDASKVDEFDEYIYLEASKRTDSRHIFDAHNFLTFSYDGKIYTLPMQSFHAYKQQFLDDGLEAIYFEEFKKFLRINRIAKVQKSKNLITEFWTFFETFILRYRGVRKENFVYYLKEAEFKFNYADEDQSSILRKLWFEHLARRT